HHTTHTPFMKRLVAMDDIRITTGSTYDNAEHLSADFLKKVRELYEGTRLGRCPTSLLFDADSRNDAMKAGVMARTFGDGREGRRVDADHPPPAHAPGNARHLPMQVTARIVETAADPTGEGVEIEMLAAPAAQRWPRVWSAVGPAAL